MKSRVSVVIPCYNGARYLRKAIDSVLEQIGGEAELIVVNDGSTDNSLMVMKEYGPRIRIVDQPNAGLPAARNAGILAGSCDLFAFLDADDWWEKHFLLKMSRALDENPSAAIAYCGWQNIGINGPGGNPFIPPDYESMPNKVEVLLCRTRWPVHATMIRRDVLFNAGLFNPALRSCEDFSLWLHTALSNPIVRVPEVLAYYRHHGDQMTSNRARIALSHYQVQRSFIAKNPRIVANITKKAIRNLTEGELLRRGFSCYWNRDLRAARLIFRAVMKQGFGSPRDWKYMLPALLPESWHRRLIRPLSGGALKRNEDV